MQVRMLHVHVRMSSWPDMNLLRKYKLKVEGSGHVILERLPQTPEQCLVRQAGSNFRNLPRFWRGWGQPCPSFALSCVTLGQSRSPL